MDKRINLPAALRAGLPKNGGAGEPHRQLVGL
jgi:hypothetical protein